VDEALYATGNDTVRHEVSSDDAVRAQAQFSAIPVQSGVKLSHGVRWIKDPEIASQGSHLLEVAIGLFIAQVVSAKSLVRV
jgi:hypothetical protein